LSKVQIDNNHKAKEIALYVGCHISTIYREIKRFYSSSSYNAKISQSEASTNMIRTNHRSPSSSLVSLIDSKLIEEQWSPNQISRWLKLHGHENISHTWIYAHIERDRITGGKLYTNLRLGKYEPKNLDYKGKIPDRITIDDRPSIIDERSRLGDYEIDLIVGTKNKGAILSILDRSSRCCILNKLNGKTAYEVEESLVSALLPYKNVLLTITSDNGNEFINHKSIAKRLDIDYYFAHPYASYERGSIENLNGLVRQYIPKGTDFANVEEKTVKIIQNKLNNRPKEVLGYYTPNEYLENITNAA
jgi:IS30 family transposase